jgi:hypothetical protein
MVDAGQWYVSGTFWTASGVISAVVIGIVTVIVTWWVGFPTRRLLYRVSSVTPLLSAPDGMRGDLELRHRGRLVGDPHVLEIELTGNGRRDIPSSAFDGGAPIAMRLSAPIVELLQIDSKSSLEAASSKVRTDEGAVLVGPCLIGRRQKISITLLVEGKPQVTCRASLVDVQIREAPERTLMQIFASEAIMVVSAVSLIAVVIAAVLIVLLNAIYGAK